MKKKSNANLAFISLRVLAGFLAATFIVFALAVSQSVGESSSRTSSANPLILDTPCDPPTCTPSAPYRFITYATDGTEIWTDLYATSLTAKPVLVMRGAGGCPPPASIWSPSSDYHLLVQETLADSDSSPVPFNADHVDGQGLLTWLAAQPWCNGRISMLGWSATGIVDYLAAPGATTALVGIQANFATGDLLNYGLFNGGVLHRETADLLGYPEVTPWEDYASLPLWSTNYLITQHDASLTHVAGIERSGWFDVFCQGTLDSFSRLQTQGGSGALGKQKLVIGPWGHGVGNGTVGQLQLLPATDPDFPDSTYNTAWHDAMFHNQWTAWNNLPAVRVYVINKNPPWTTYNTWPPAPGYEYPLYFASGNSLKAGDPAPPAASPVPFTSNPSSPCPTLGGTNNLISCVPCLRPDGTCGPYDQRPIEGRSDVAVFTSPAGVGGMVGRIHADVWIQTDLPDVDVFVRMTDVYPPDAFHRFERSMLMAQGIQRARYRNGVCAEPLPPNTPTLVRVDLGSMALVWPADHKIRVTVSATAGPSLGSSLYPLYSINPQNGDEYVGAHPNRTGTINVLVGGTHPSALWIPVLPASGTPPPDRRPNTTPCPF
jgi:uncharacterized protein